MICFDKLCIVYPSPFLHFLSYVRREGGGGYVILFMFLYFYFYLYFLSFRFSLFDLFVLDWGLGL